MLELEVMYTPIDYRLVAYDYRLYRVLKYKNRGPSVEIATVETDNNPSEWVLVSNPETQEKVIEESRKEV